jgi:hypothetical protein
MSNDNTTTKSYRRSTIEKMSPTRAAIALTRDNGGIVSFRDDKVHVEFPRDEDIPLEFDNLIRYAGFLTHPVQPKGSLRLFSRK